jgi:hypothetical protein
LVHRDVKPANLLLDRTGLVKILDLGLARFFDGRADNLTKQFEDKAVLGTADYVAPEQAMYSSDVDIRADIYSLGATGYCLLTGAAPFAEGSTTQKLLWHQMLEPKRIEEIRPELPKPLADVIHRMMAKNPNERYATPAAVTEALAPWTTEKIGAPSEHEMPPVLPILLRVGSTSTSTTASTPCLASTTTVGTKKSPSSSPSQPRPGQTPRTANPSKGASAGGKSSAKRPLPMAKHAAGPGTASTGPSPKSWWPTQKSALVGGVAVLLAGLCVVALLSLTSSAQTDKIHTAPGDGSRKSADAASHVADETYAPPAGRLPLLVCRVADAGGSGQPNIFSSLAAALAKAQPGDLIRVVDQIIEEPLSVDDPRLKNVAVQAFPKSGTSVLWRPPSNWDRKRPLISLNDAEGLRINGFTIDGENRVDHLIKIQGQCPNLRLSRLQLRGFNDCAVRFQNALGTEAAPVIVNRVRTTTGEQRGARAALIFTGDGHADRLKVNEHILVADSRFEGPYEAGAVADSSLVKVEFQRNRFYQMKNSVSYLAAEPPYSLQLTLVSNTFAEVRDAALHFEALPKVSASDHVDWRLNLLYHVRAPALVGRYVSGKLVNDAIIDELRVKQLFGFPQVQLEGNFRDYFSNENEGYTWLAGARDIDPLSYNKEEDKQFLHYTKTAPLASGGPHGEPVGVPPE